MYVAILLQKIHDRVNGLEVESYQIIKFLPIYSTANSL